MNGNGLNKLLNLSMKRRYKMISKKELLSRLAEVENHVLWLDGRIDKLEEKLKRVKKEKKDDTQE